MNFLTVLKDNASFGLGCSRLGSIRGASERESYNLIGAALDDGITFFDTAASYGQGQSEVIIGRATKGRNDVCIATKLGKIVPLKARVLRPIKGLVRKISNGSTYASNSIASVRGAELPVCFDVKYLSRQFDSSRKRLGMTCVPMVMLHSPDKRVIDTGDAIDFLCKEKEKGNLCIVGVSVDDNKSARAAITDERIEAIQMPYYSGDMEAENIIKLAKQSGKITIAREIFRSPSEGYTEMTADHIINNVNRCLNNGDINITLIGTTRVNHLRQITSIKINNT